MSSDGAVLTAAAKAFWEGVVHQGGHVDRAAIAPENDPLVDELMTLCLLAPHRDDPAVLIAVDPRIAKIKSGVLHYEAALRMVGASESLGSVVDRLSQAYHEGIPAGPATLASSETVIGATDITERVAELVQHARTEVLHLRPIRAEGDGSVNRLVESACRPGLVWHALMQTASRLDSTTQAMMRQAITNEGEVRTSPLLVESMLVIDAHYAVVPAAPIDDPAGAESMCVITDQAVVDYLRACFQAFWSGARPYDPDADGGESIEELYTEILHLLGQGLDQAEIGDRLGLAKRTMTKYIARLKERYKVNSLFQLGAAVRSR